MNDFFASNPAWRAEDLRRMASAPSVTSAPTAIMLLAQSMAMEGGRVEGQALYERILRSKAYSAHLGESMTLLDALGLLPPKEMDLGLLSRFAWYLRLDFKLETAYLSRDDRPFSIIENPVRKDRVFEVPVVAGTTWKGALKNACRLLDKKTRLASLFGTAPDGGEEEDPKAMKGSLHFYPTFFRGVGLETINPHDRKTRTGKNPIRIECVPRGSQGTFALLYAPMLHISDDEAAADVRLVTESCRAMLSDFGFAAKKSSGYGAAADQLAGGDLFVNGIAGWATGLNRLGDLPGKGEAVAKYFEVVV
jgi:CRISPR-associated protein Cmr2